MHLYFSLLQRSTSEKDTFVTCHLVAPKILLLQVSCYIYIFLFTKTSSQLLFTVCYFLQEQVILKNCYKWKFYTPHLLNQKLWAEAQETRRAGCLPMRIEFTTHLGLCLGHSRHYLKATSCYLCTHVWGWCSYGCMCIYMYGGQRSNSGVLPQELSTLCLTGVLIDLGSPIRHWLMSKSRDPPVSVFGIANTCATMTHLVGTVRGIKFMLQHLLGNDLMIEYVPSPLSLPF